MAKRLAVTLPVDAVSEDIENVILVPDEWTLADVDAWGGIPEGRSRRMLAREDRVGPGDLVDLEANPPKPVRRPSTRGQEIIAGRGA